MRDTFSEVHCVPHHSGTHVSPPNSTCHNGAEGCQVQSSKIETRQDANALAGKSNCTYVHACVMWLISHFVDITMPPIIRKRGRPKGHEVTVIGLPAKKLNKGGGGGSSSSDSAASKEKLVPFIKLHTSLKEKG